MPFHNTPLSKGSKSPVSVTCWPYSGEFLSASGFGSGMVSGVATDSHGAGRRWPFFPESDFFSLAGSELPHGSDEVRSRKSVPAPKSSGEMGAVSFFNTG